jgi:HD domain
MSTPNTGPVELAKLTALATVLPDIELPGSELSRRVLSLVSSAESPAVANHSIRSYVFACLLGTHLGVSAGKDYDGQLLFAACVMHDIGLGAGPPGPQRFEVDGADRAAALLTDHGLPAADVDAVWEAIALHTSAGIAERRGRLCQLVRAGVGLDFGVDTDFVTDAQAKAIHAAFPRLDMARALVDTIVAQADGCPSKAPAYSIADGLQRERAAAPHRSRLELLTSTARWGS